MGARVLINETWYNVKVAPTKVKNPVNAVIRHTFSKVAMMLPLPTPHMGKAKNGESLSGCLLSNFSTEIFWRRCAQDGIVAPARATPMLRRSDRSQRATLAALQILADVRFAAHCGL